MELSFAYAFLFIACNCMVIATIEKPGDIKWPENVAATSGQSVSLQCQSLDGGAVAWSVCTSNGICELISIGETIVHSNTQKYSIQEFDRVFILTIDKVTSADAKTYRCQSPLLQDGLFLEVIVTDSSMDCEFNTSQIVEDHITALTCRVGFSGRWAPSIRCRISSLDWLPGVDESTKDNAVWRMTFLPSYETNDKEIFCETFFEYPKSWEKLSEVEAKNVPESQGNIWLSLPMNVHYGPTNVNVTPKSVVLELGQVITCKASANPEPLFVWSDVTSGQILSNDPELSFIDKHDVGLRYVMCEAQNTIDEQVFKEHLVVEVLVCNEDSCESTGVHIPTVVIGTVLGVLLGASLVVNVLLVLAIKRNQDDQEPDCDEWKKPPIILEKPSDPKPPAFNSMDKKTLPFTVSNGNIRTSRGAPTLPADFYHSINDDDVHSVISSKDGFSICSASDDDENAPLPSDGRMANNNTPTNHNSDYSRPRGMRWNNSDNNLQDQPKAIYVRRVSCPAIDTRGMRTDIRRSSEGDDGNTEAGSVKYARRSTMAGPSQEPSRDPKRHYANYDEWHPKDCSHI